MSGRWRDKYRKFISGGEKRKLKIAIELEHQNGRQKNSLFKFFKKDLNDTIADSGQIESQINANLQLSDSDDVNFEKVEVQCNTVSDKYENVPIADSVQIESQINVNLQLSDSDDVNSEKVEVLCNSDCDEYENENVQLVSDDLRPKEDIESRKVLEKEYNNDDPGNWPQNINDKLRIYLVKNPPSKIKNYKFPSNYEGRKFSVIHYNRIMANGENVLRNWLLYSKSLNRVFCLYCHLFPSKSTSGVFNPRPALS